MIAFMIKNKPFERITIPHGYANGYVAVTMAHSQYLTHYDEVSVIVHGGLTYSEKATGKEIKENNIISVKNDIVDDQKYWVFGFDTRHFNDNLDTCNKEYCIDQTMKLYHQLNE